MPHKLLPGDVDIDSGLGSHSVFGHAGEEVADYELVNPGLVPMEAVCVLDWVDRRMGLIRLLSLSRVWTIPLIKNSKLKCTKTKID